MEEAFAGFCIIMYFKVPQHGKDAKSIQNKKRKIEKKYIMYLSEMKNGQISTCQWRTVRTEEVRFWETWHGRYTENRCICVYTERDTQRTDEHV